VIVRPQGWRPAAALPLVVYPVACVLFLGAASPIYSVTQRLLALALFALGTWPLVRFAQRPNGVLLLELVALQYAIFFALPVFHQDRIATTSGYDVPRASAVTMSLTIALLALAGTMTGYVFSRRLLQSGAWKATLDIPGRRLFVFALLAILGVHLLPLLGLVVSNAWSRPLSVLLSQDLGVALLGCLYHQGRLNLWQKYVALLAVALAIAIGLLSGMAQSALQPLLIWFLCSWLGRRKPPVVGFSVLAAIVIMVQPLKGEYRQAIWYGPRAYSMAEKVRLLGDLFTEEWFGGGLSTEAVTEKARDAASERLSLLLSTARYVEWTPSVIDYKQGSTLLYLAYGWIPRVVWPDKPIAQTANVELPVAYGLQSIRSVKTTRFGVGHVAEAYVNFGPLGILPIFLILGALFRVPEVMLGRHGSAANMAICIALAVNMMYIGSTIGNVFGGFVQQIVVQVFLLRLLARRSTKAADASARVPRRPPSPPVVARPT
jgi:hypothetical protein